eukprot:COSAG02_NODE_28708_length_584_cov_0.843299_1_plen_85_part_10
MINGGQQLANNTRAVRVARHIVSYRALVATLARVSRLTVANRGGVVPTATGAVPVAWVESGVWVDDIARVHCRRAAKASAAAAAA